MDFLQSITPNLLTIIFTIFGVALVVWGNQTRLFDKIDHLEHTVNIKLLSVSDSSKVLEKRIIVLEDFKEFVYRDAILKSLKGEK